MNVVKPSKFNCLKTPPPSSIEPIAREVGVYELSRMIAKKTKFRVCDVEEVMREVGNAIFMVLMQRNSVNLDGLYIRNRWTPNDEPTYFRGKDEFWSFGYFMPKIEMNLERRSLFSGKSIVYQDKFFDEISPYAPDGVENFDDLIQIVKSCLEENAKLGKDVIVDKDGYYLPKGKKKKKIFDENFHPTWGEYVKYHSARKKIIKEYWARKKSGEEIEFQSFVIGELVKQGFKIVCGGESSGEL